MSAAAQLALFDVFVAPRPPAREPSGPLPIAAVSAPAAQEQAARIAGTTEDRCLAMPAKHWSDELVELLEATAQRAEEDVARLREMHAKILGCTVDELDERVAAEEAQRKAEREEARASRPAPARAKPSRGRTEAGSSGIGASRLTERERELLHNLRVESNVAVYVPEERIPDWKVLKRVVVALGGKWRSRKGFVFPDDVDAQELVRLALETGEILDPRKADFFATPAALADRVVALADIRPGDRVLEPSAGRGAIALAVRRACPEARVICIEPLPDNRAVLEAEGFELIGSDFLLEGDVVGAFDAIVMNPPFSKRADLVHVEHALHFLRPGGSLVAIMSAGAKYRDDKRGRAFRELVIDQLGGRFEDNPNGSFLESGTGVRTVTLVIPRRTA